MPGPGPGPGPERETDGPPEAARADHGTGRGGVREEATAERCPPPAVRRIRAGRGERWRRDRLETTCERLSSLCA